MRLILGAGDRRKDGWKAHDVQALDDLDYKCDFWELPQHVEAGSCEEIEMTHMLEHFPMKDTHRALELVHSLLAPGGKLYIEVPNFAWHALEIVVDPTNRQIVEYAYGGQLNEWDFHYMGFTPEILHEDLENAGFVVDELRPNSSIECWGHKA